MHETAEILHFPASCLPVLTLYLAGNSPSARKARANLRVAMASSCWASQLAVREIDVLQDSAHALTEGLLATPSLCIISRGTRRWFAGDLGLVSVLRKWLATEAAG